MSHAIARCIDPRAKVLQDRGAENAGRAANPAVDGGRTHRDHDGRDRAAAPGIRDWVMSRIDPVVIAGMARTPLGAFQGELASKTAPELGAVAIRAAIARAGIAPVLIDEVTMGCVLPAGIGQAPARQAALAADLPVEVPCTTVNKMCGSGMKAVMLAHDALVAGSARIAVAGGMESMSNAPYLVPKARGGLRLGHGQLLDHMFFDGLEDAYEKGRLMGSFAEDAARHFQFGREQQDAYAIESLRRAQRAMAEGRFTREIVAVVVQGRAGAITVDQDEQPRTASPEKIPKLKPAFARDGTVTPANSSSISDGAAALVLTTESAAEHFALQPLARIVAHAAHAGPPAWFTTAPVGAIRKVLDQAGWSADDVERYEINEAFAVVAMIALRELGLPHDKVNVRGGACALGHPIGASGARILVTLLAALQDAGLRRGVASLCIGGGEATAIALELV
jgi:acetyl-CoA C-acetyltransferase